jgi:hypothetical protein
MDLRNISSVLGHGTNTTHVVDIEKCPLEVNAYQDGLKSQMGAAIRVV